MLWLLLPALAHAYTAPEVLGTSKEAVRICSRASALKEELEKIDPACIFTKICRESVRDAYAPLFRTCSEVIPLFQELANSAKCPKKEGKNCRLNRKLLPKFGEKGESMEKSVDENIEGESIDKGCDEYDNAFRHNKYDKCPGRREVEKVRDLQKKLLAEGVLPLARLLKEFSEGKK